MKTETFCFLRVLAIKFAIMISTIIVKRIAKLDDFSIISSSATHTFYIAYSKLQYIYAIGTDGKCDDIGILASKSC